jgi:mRNA interferase HigB
MIVTSFSRLIAFGRQHADARRWLTGWLRVVQDAQWKSFLDVKRAYQTADRVTLESGRVVTVFNVRGNNYRLITAIDYGIGIVNVIEVLTHADYDKEKWKSL